MSTCAICGDPMPPGEESFRYHGFSGPCPKPPLEKPLRDGTIPTRMFDPKNIPPDEPVFVLRAQDALAAELVELWALRARAAGTHNDKVRSAFAISEDMKNWRIRKEPD